MKLEKNENLIHYLVLLAILNIGIVAFLFFSYNKLYQLVVVGSMSGMYVLWGIIHHHLSEDLHLKVVLEYLLIALLAMAVVVSLLYRA